MRIPIQLLLIVAALYLIGCTGPEIVTEEIEVPFNEQAFIDTIHYEQLPSNAVDEILKLDEPSTVTTDPTRYRFSVNNLLQLRTSGSDSIIITSYVAQTLHNLDFYVYIEAVDRTVKLLHFDSIPAFSQIAVKPAIVETENLYPTLENEYVSLKLPSVAPLVQSYQFVSDDPLWQKLTKITAQWDITFSNFSATPTRSWYELRAIYAREWVVIATNYAYMMTTDAYSSGIDNFKEIYGKDLFNNDSTLFTPEQYQSIKERFLRYHRFNCGRTGGGVGGLGGGSAWGITHWNFYGHYASYSGWEVITHEFMHCMGYGHSSNMTYANGGVGWTVFIAELHAYLRFNDNLPYTDRDLLGFHLPENEPYRDGGIDMSKINDAASLKFYENSKIKRFFDNTEL